MDPLSGAASVIAVVQLAGNIFQICEQYLKNVKNATQDIQRFQEQIATLTQVLQSLYDLIQGPNGNTLTTTQDLINNIAKCSSVLGELKVKIDPEITQQGLRRQWGFRAWKWPLARSEVDYTIKELDWYKATFSLSLQVDQARSTNSIHQKIDLSRLQPAKGAAFDSYDNQHSECLPGTRIDLLQEIDEWAKSPQGKCIFWLNGMAGTGKSTISRTVASRLKQQQQLLGASFFFKRGEEDRGTAKKLFPTLIKQLVNSIPQILPRVQNAIKDDPDISEKALTEQFERLLLFPLIGIEQREETARRVIVIDALDECDSEDDIGIVLRLLPQVQKSTAVHLRFLLTSRPELPIRLGFKAITDAHQDFTLHEIERAVIEHDIALYFQDQFRRLKQTRSFPQDWPGDAATRKLVARAVPLFIAATTLCRFIGDSKWNPQKRLEAILTDQATYASRMDSTYIPVLKQLLSGQDETESQQLRDEFKEIVGVIIILATPLSIKPLGQLVDREPDDVKCRLDQLHSVLSVPNDFDTPVRLLHLSFRDFLLDHRKDKSKFWIDEKYANQRLTARCFQIMQRSLHKNICHLPNEGTECNDLSKDSIRHYVTPELKYACRYWAYHLVRCIGLADLIYDAFSFLRSHFLHWVEAMSLLGRASEMLGILNDFQTVVSGDGSSRNLNFLHDAKRFILKNVQIVDQAPLQVYCAALIFAPETSIIRRHFQEELPSWICQLPRVEERWGAEVQTLEGHSKEVESVVFSRDGRLLASGSHDNTVRLWDPATGVLTQTLKGHLGPVRSVAFSSDGRLLASGSDDKTVRLWDPLTGVLIQKLEGHLKWVLSVTFSPDNRLLASGSLDKILYLWDPTTGGITQTLQGHIGSVVSVAFSSDSRLLASGSDDKTVRLWDPLTGVLIQILEGHPTFVWSVTFSPDDRVLASSSNDNIIRLWNPVTGALTRKIDSSANQVLSVTFSSDSRLLASGSNDKTIRLWDSATGAPTHTLKGHSYLVHSVAFSPDGRLLASGSSDNTVRLWDPATGARTQPMKGHSERVEWVAFSPSGRVLISSSGDNIIGLWDPATGALTNTLEGYSSYASSGTFSPDERLLATGTNDGKVQLWDLVTGTLSQQFEGHSSAISLVAFSTDGRLLASTSGVQPYDMATDVFIQADNTVRLWDVATGTLTRTLEGHLEIVTSVAFSPDSRLMASGSKDNTVRLWDVVTGALARTWNVEKVVTTLEFSYEGSHLRTNSGWLDIESG
ncbi:hypothetical protein PENARI_c002G03634 [Penicillium arizonense]|uniref:NACHT domain-containing protein n=1 Tax=Penicillium arizonense TaxID=1835702 RepID=A0A1F5LVM1_PENAI|nr:hypothetical protein PENARI_c002G03634 [Penicillium arizonense]OGE57195.1 hypothetical protein PENARI_c002G03634 [Penicillium arizonense]